ncbi:MAG: deoxyribose-phosphate aldolase [Saprospiraceae bacterium]|nr:deoxyribose-phosphate aldolase [Saprospiraceae bacterium]
MDLAKFIDHTVLKPDTTLEEIRRVCAEALEHGFAAVCVPPYFAKQAVDLLEGSKVKVATVIGFPMGYSATFAKVEEIKRALNEGVSELDVVINISAAKNGDWNHVRNDMDSMTRSAHLKGKLVKVILETALMTEPELKKLCEICTELEVDYVKTSTGINATGATVEHVQFLRKNLPASIKIKASGGIRSAELAQELIEAGANRIGSSSSLKIVGKNS